MIGTIRCSSPRTITAVTPTVAGLRIAFGAVRAKPPTSPPVAHATTRGTSPAGTPRPNVRKSINGSVTLVNTSRMRSTPNASANPTAAANPIPTIAPVRVPATSPSPRDGADRSPATTRGRVTTYAARIAGATTRIRLKVTGSPTSSRSTNRVNSPTNAR